MCSVVYMTFQCVYNEKRDTNSFYYRLCSINSELTNLEYSYFIYVKSNLRNTYLNVSTIIVCFSSQRLSCWWDNRFLCISWISSNEQNDMLRDFKM